MSDQQQPRLGGAQQLSDALGQQDTGGLNIPTGEADVPEHDLEGHRTSPTMDHPRGSVKQFHLEPELWAAIKKTVNLKAIGSYTLVTGNITMSVGSAYRVSSSGSSLDGGPKLSLPASATEGDRIEIETDGYCRIVQTDAQHLIESPDSAHQTIQGVSVLPPDANAGGYMQLVPGTKLTLVYRGAPDEQTVYPAMTPVLLAGASGLGTPVQLSVSFDGTYIALVNSIGTVSVCKRAAGTDTWSLLPALPASGISSGLTGCAWSRDATFLIIGSANVFSQYLTVYRRNSDDSFTIVQTGNNNTIGPFGAAAQFSKFSSYPGSQILYDYVPTGTGYALRPKGASTWNFSTVSTSGLPCISPDGRFMAVGLGATPFAQIDMWNGSYVAALPALQAGLNVPTKSVWTTDGRFVFFHQATTSPYIWGYRHNDDDTFSLLPALTASAVGAPANLALAAGRSIVAMGIAASPTVYTYIRDENDSWTRGNPIAANGNIISIECSADGKYFAIASGTGFQILKTKGSIATKTWGIENWFSRSRDVDLASAMR